jgi:HNH/ENDO VII superfamily nuclease
MRRLLVVLVLALVAGLTVPAVAPAADVRTWYLRNSNSTGIGDIWFPYGSPGDIPVVGDWNGDGRDSPAMVYPPWSAWFLSNGFTSVIDASFVYGAVGDVPVAGDWDGNRTSTVGVRRGLRWYLSNVNAQVFASIVFDLGDPTGMIPLSGDWDGDGRDTPGVYHGATGRFHLSSGFTSACCYASPTFGNPNDFPVVGDWNGDGRDTVGVVRSSSLGLRWYLNNALDGSAPEYSFTYGNPGDHPVVGDWDANGTDTPGVVRVTPPPAPDPYPSSTWFGGANRTIDTEAEIDTAIDVMTPESGREAIWNGLRPEDKQNLAARDAFAIWGEAAADDSDSADLGSYEVWDGEDVELDQWIPLGDQFQVTTQTPEAHASAGPAIIAVALGCLRYCDDAVRATRSAAKFAKKVVKGKKPRPKLWRAQKPYVHWIGQAGSKPSKVLADNLGDVPHGARSLWRPHHIIAAGSRAARTAQSIAWQCGIHPNSALNGVWLPVDGAAKSSLGTTRHAHNRLHTTHYYTNVNKLIWTQFYKGLGDEATRCGRVVEALKLLKDSLRDGSMLY